MNLKKYLPQNLCSWLEIYGKNATDITLIAEKNMFISEKGAIKEAPYTISKEELSNIVVRMCKGSIYANQNTLKDGYIALEEGFRVGVTGTCVYSEDGKIAYMRDITAINIRVARNIPSAAAKVISAITDGTVIHNTLIISPPGAGKTTMLRDIAKSLGDMFRIGIVDERSEIAFGANLGKYSVVTDKCNKHDGILMLLRSMAPSAVLTDEIGSSEDEAALEKLVNAGVKIICTAHGYDEKDAARRKTIGNMLKEGVFDRVIVLSSKNGPGTVEKIINQKGAVG